MYKDVPLSEIADNPFQPRQDFDPASVRSLADEIQAEGYWNGTLQGRRNARGQVELVFGHRRLRALKLLKIPSVRMEILELTDADMARRALVENLQRQGLTDFEKADAVRQAVELEKQQRTDRGEPERGAVHAVAKSLGFTPQWVSELCGMSDAIASDERQGIAGALTAKAACDAKKWGGTRYVQTLVRQAHEAQQANATVSKPTEHTVAAMKRIVMAAPDTVRPKLEARVFNGEFTSPEQVETAARRMNAEHVKREKLPLPDLEVAIVGVTRHIEDLNTKLREALPYMDYVDEAPRIADAFRGALTELIATANEMLKAAE